MKLFDTGTRKSSVALLIVLCGAILFAAVLFRISDLIAIIRTGFNILLPLFLGLVFAMLISPVVKGIERLLRFFFCRKKNRTRLCRTLSTVITYLLLLGLVIGCIFIIVPQLISSIVSLSVKVTRYIQSNSGVVEELFQTLNVFGLDLSGFLITWESMISKLLEYSGKALASIVSISTGIGNGVAQFSIAIAFSVYMVLYSEKLCAQSKKIACALCPRETAERMIFWTRKTYSIFSKYIVGIILVSLIVGVLCYLFMLIVRFEYALLISVIICVTNVLPYFGPIIGGGIGCLILLVVNPMHALWFLLFLLVMQQVEGNIISPRILGSSIGISPFWILLAIILGSGIWGVGGILFSIPIMGLIYAFVKAYTERRLVKKGMPKETDAYLPEGALPGEQQQ
ncbi:MAG: AI-2E family transporter [Christensenellales bacterium]|jgi:predicted PurR-regulated permease PerM